MSVSMYRRYRIVIFTFAGLALVYAAIASVSVTRIIEQREIFPFYSWSLFSSPRRMIYQLVATLEDAYSDALPRTDASLPQGDEYLWLPIESEAKMPHLRKALRGLARDLSGGGKQSEAFAKWRSHLDPFVPEGYSGYYIVRLDIIEFHQSKGRNRTGQTLGYFKVER